ncbi:MAG: DUF1800 domain-containing protein [Betaproteobacteria bacterium]|nr:DUF1800 domain-containing protein [Betaproteobacteria bacterium]
MLPITILRALTAALLGASATLAPAAAPLGFDDARHLLSRTVFAPPPAQIEAFARLTRAQAVERLLDGASTPRVTPAPAWVNEPVTTPQALRNMTREERQLWNRRNVARVLEMRGWWLQEMVATPTPFTEKMVLFWHNHFVSSQQKVRQSQYLYRQNLLFREHALGNFGALLHAIARDPAMVIYLDSASNRKGQPNENFAREVMELFTLGEGHYGERDVKEAARAFTGLGVDPEKGEFLFRPQVHDDGVKTVLGRSGNFDGKAVLDILLEQPQTAEFIVGKLWREFVSPDVNAANAAEVKRIAAVFRDSRYDVRAALRAMLMSDAFYAPQNRATLVKSPVDLVAGTLRQFQFAATDVAPFALVVGRLGQNLFAPPNVRGWPGGEAWINSSTLLARKQFLDRLFVSEAGRAPPAMAAMVTTMAANAPAPAPEMTPGAAMNQRLQRAFGQLYFETDRWMSLAGSDVAQVQRQVLAMAPRHALPPDASGIEMVRRLTQDPVYQLK